MKPNERLVLTIEVVVRPGYESPVLPVLAEKSLAGAWAERIKVEEEVKPQ